MNEASELILQRLECCPLYGNFLVVRRANPAFRSLASLIASRLRRRRRSAQFALLSSHAPSRSLLRPRLGP